MALEKILLVRHDVTGADTGYIQGQRDTPLQQGFRTRIDGLTDIIASEEELTLKSGVHIHVVSSNLGHTYGTAQRIMHRLWEKYGRKAELRYSEYLRERGQGDLEGKSFEEALPLLSDDPNLKPDAQTIYGLLYLSKNIPNGETHEAVTARLERFVRDYIQRLQGIGIVVNPLISGTNYLGNLLIHGNILGNPSAQPFPQPFQYCPNLSVVILEPATSFMRYRELR